MSKILQLTVGIFGALLLSGFSSGGEPRNPDLFWTPTSTENVKRVTSTPSALRTLVSPQLNGAQVEQIRPLTTSFSNNEEVARILEEGNAALNDGRWTDAKKLFEKALRVSPNDPLLQARFAEARRRQEIEIRYQDSSFTELTRASELGDQLTIFDEVFLDVDMYHVDHPQYFELFELGIAGVSEALSEDAFYLQNKIPIERKEQTEQLFASLREVTSGWTLETQDDVRRAVLWLGKQLRRRAGIDESVVVSEFLCSAVCSLDAYSTSLSPMQVEDVFSMIDGRFVGLGVELKTDLPSRVVRVIPGSPAQECGIQVGDDIVEIDGTSTENLTGTEVGQLLQGREGEKATLLVREKNDRLKRVIVTRRSIDVPSVEDVHILDVPGNIGYMKISCFQKTTANELEAALEKLSRQRVTGLVIDLRQNPGGLLQEAINVSDLFLSSGTIVQTKGRNGSHKFVAHLSQNCGLPLVLLVDSNSASAAEIFAGAIQENNRGVVVGVQSYGKGTVQAIVQLTHETKATKPVAGLRLTTEKFYSPRGRAYSGIGVLPDINVLEEQEKLQLSQQKASVYQAYGDSVEAQEESSFEETEERYETGNNVQYVARKPVNEVDADLFISIAVREINRQTTSEESKTSRESKSGSTCSLSLKRK